MLSDIKSSRCKFVLAASVVAVSMAAGAVNEWKYRTTTPTWWYASATNWTYGTFPAAGEEVYLGDFSKPDSWVYLDARQAVSGIGRLSVSYGWTGELFTLELRSGADLSASGGLRIGSVGVQTYGRLFVTNATLTLTSGGITVGGGTYHSTDTNPRSAGRGYFGVTDNSAVTVVGGSLTVGNFTISQDYQKTPGEVGRFDLIDSSYTVTSWGSAIFGTSGDASVYPAPAPISIIRSTMVTGELDIHGTAAVAISNSTYAMKTTDWSTRAPLIMIDCHQTQTNRVFLTDSALVVYRPEWESSASGGNYGRWYKVAFKGLGYSEFIQDNSIVTNTGVWFWPVENTGNVYPLKPPKYIVKGGELYVYNSVNYGDYLRGYPNGSSACGFAAATNAPNSGTISLVDAPKVTYPRVCTNLLLAGAGQATEWQYGPRVFGLSQYRPHFEFVLTKKGSRPMTITEESTVLGMFSFVPQGGLQIVQTNRFPLVRHKTASTTLATGGEAQFRAPNAALWTTGGFADTPCEWGVTLKSAAEIANGADLGAGVPFGSVKIPGKWRDELKSGTVRLKMSPRAKTLAAIAADLTAAGYPASVENTDEVVVDLKSSGMLKPGRDNRILFDFTEPPDAIQVRDRVVTTNAVVLGVTAEYARSGLAVVLK